jgi:hypothetical protein
VQLINQQHQQQQELLSPHHHLEQWRLHAGMLSVCLKWVGVINYKTRPLPWQLHNSSSSSMPGNKTVDARLRLLNCYAYTLCLSGRLLPMPQLLHGLAPAAAAAAAAACNLRAADASCRLLPGSSNEAPASSMPPQPGPTGMMQQ